MTRLTEYTVLTCAKCHIHALAGSGAVVLNEVDDYASEQEQRL